MFFVGIGPETGKRIDAFLTSKIDASRVTVQRLIEEEKI